MILWQILTRQWAAYMYTLNIVTRRFPLKSVIILIKQCRIVRFYTSNQRKLTSNKYSSDIHTTTAMLIAKTRIQSMNTYIDAILRSPIPAILRSPIPAILDYVTLENLTQHSSLHYKKHGRLTLLHCPCKLRRHYIFNVN